ncbi:MULTISPECIES: Ku protein [unclassified Pseudoclavibacter]|uniref:non-homologous end joining protein Ku n=1 Tax=unclassified Pseudoclavibacter TaxID=2615177 RepID=UPI000CE7D2BD|nr:MULTISPECIES: Ku protein [unclassified Pseudoclavibacter]MBF4549166.1 Ku protein [Pseudoclavibacter sp. VKM Ac-2888]PPF75916.1 Ku protein [Pseudoclavibacter sp. Z016]PPG02815.1 Ku protein [Pseudoclavibacter sp. RFBI5]
MRSIWKGSIAFGLVNVPVKLYSATEDHDVHLHQVHDKDGGRIRYQRRCEVCGKVVDFEHIDKAYAEEDRTVVLTEEDLSSLPEERSREIDVVEFVPSRQLDPIMFDRSYFLEPDSKSAKAYVLLRKTLEKTDRTAIVHFSLRQKSRLGALRTRGDVLMLQSLLWDDEVREAKFPALDERVRISAKELKMSASLVDSFAADFAPDRFTDDYQEQLQQLIDAKLAEGDALDTAATFGESEDSEPGGEVIDLMEALRRSIDKGKTTPAKKGVANKTRSSAGAQGRSGKKKAGAKKNAASKTTPKKSAPAKQGKTKAAPKADASAKRTKAGSATRSKAG